MKTKAEIVQRLLSENKIDAEEAVVLLMKEENVTYVPYYPVSPYIPINPYIPLPQPTWIRVGETTLTSGAISDNECYVVLDGVQIKPPATYTSGYINTPYNA